MMLETDVLPPSPQKALQKPEVCRGFLKPPALETTGRSEYLHTCSPQYQAQTEMKEMISTKKVAISPFVT